MANKDRIIHKKVKGTEMVFRSLSLPASLVEDLQLLKECFENTWFNEDSRERVTYEKIFQILLSNSGLGHVEPEVYAEFQRAKEFRKKSPAVVTRATRGIIGDLYKRIQAKESTTLEEARAEFLAAANAKAEEVRIDSFPDLARPASDSKQLPEPMAAQESPSVTKKRWKETFWLIGPEGQKVKVSIKNVNGVCSFSPEDTTSWNNNYGNLMTRHKWKMTDNQGNELSYWEAKTLIDDFEANHEL